VLLACTSLPGIPISQWWGHLTVTLSDYSQQSSGYFLTAGVVSSHYKHYFLVHSLPGDGSLTATGLAYFYQDWSHSVFGGYPVGTVGNMSPATQALYASTSMDIFDVIMVMPNNRLFIPGTYLERTPHMYRTSNAIEHIGISIYNNSATWGSTGYLKGVIYHSFGVPSIFPHELGHLWATNFGHGGANLQIDDGSHWASNTDIAGMMSAYYSYGSGQYGHFVSNGDGTWHLVPNTTNEQFSTLDLYLMGMAAPYEVPPANILINPNTSDPNHVTVDGVTTYTIDQMAANQGGYRDPDSYSSPSEISVGLLVISDGYFYDEEYAFFSLLSLNLMSTAWPTASNYYDRTFYWATHGRGTIYSYLPYQITNIQQVYLPLVTR